LRSHGLFGVAALLAVAGCASNPDPRGRHVAVMEQSTLGGWIIVTDRHGRETHGELISVEPSLVRVIAWSPPDWASRATTTTARSPYKPAPVEPEEQPTTLVALPRSEIARAKLFRYTANDWIAWGMGGTISTVTHFIFLKISFPAWVIATITAASIETRHVILEYPGDSLEEIAQWARFPQGMPPVLDLRALTPTDPTRPSL